MAGGACDDHASAGPAETVIWVTGIGVVSPLGVGAELTFDRLVRGDGAVGELQLFEPADCRSRLAAEVRELDVAQVAPPEQLDTWSRTDAMAVMAAREALLQAHLTPDASEGSAVDLIVGGSTAGMFETEKLLAEMSKNPDSIEPLKRMLSHPLSATADRMLDTFGLLRDARTVCSACSSGANALILGASRLLSGRSSCVLAGGADGLCRLTYVGFNALAALSPAPCRPFSTSRSGLTLGEGAAFLVLETEAHARERGVEALAEFRGWAVGSEAHHITHPEPTGETASRVMASALAMAELEPTQVGYLNAHGTATPLNDAMEIAAIKRCFGPAAPRLMVSSSKGQIGHTLAAAGAMEAAISVMVVQHGRVPPTVGLGEIDDACAGVDHVTDGRRQDVAAAMSTSFGFGGSDTALLFSRPGAFENKSGFVRRRVFVTAAATLGAEGICGAEDAGRHVRGGDPESVAKRIEFKAADYLDLKRARRLDRPARMVTAVVEHGLAQSGCPASRLADAGAIVAAAYGSVDACANYVQRFTDRGARFASPAVFPNLLPSSPVAHASVYLGLGGPVFASADVGATAEGAMVAAVELLEVGQGRIIAAGGVEEASDIIDRALGPLCTGHVGRGPRSEGAAVLVFEAEVGDGDVMSRAIAEVVWSDAWRDRCDWLGLPAPVGRSGVFVATDVPALGTMLTGSGWAKVSRYSVSGRVGHHECAGGFASAAAVSLLAAGKLDMAFVIGLAPVRQRALVLRACPHGAKP